MLCDQLVAEALGNIHDCARSNMGQPVVSEPLASFCVMNPRVVMQIGGWDSFQAIEPYLNAPTPEVVNNAFEEAGLA